MISGNTPKKISEFIFIDRRAEGISWTRPGPDEYFVGIPYSYYEDQSQPHIEIRLKSNGHVIKTINAMDCSEICFFVD